MPPTLVCIRRVCDIVPRACSWSAATQLGHYLNGGLELDAVITSYKLAVLHVTARLDVVITSYKLAVLHVTARRVICTSISLHRGLSPPCIVV
jgi:hypothetical protein